MGQINHTALREILQDDQELLMDLATIFAKSVSDIAARLRLAMMEQDASLLEETAHQIKSRVSYFAATELHCIASLLEQNGKSGVLADTQASVEQLLDGIDELLSELRVITNLPLPVSDD